MKILDEKDIRKGVVKRKIDKRSLRAVEPEPPKQQVLLVGQIVGALQQLTATVKEFDKDQPNQEIASGLAGVQGSLEKIAGDLTELVAQASEKRKWKFIVHRNREHDIESIEAVKE